MYELLPLSEKRRKEGGRKGGKKGREGRKGGRKEGRKEGNNNNNNNFRTSSWRAGWTQPTRSTISHACTFTPFTLHHLPTIHSLIHACIQGYQNPFTRNCVNTHNAEPSLSDGIKLADKLLYMSCQVMC